MNQKVIKLLCQFGRKTQGFKKKKVVRGGGRVWQCMEHRNMKAAIVGVN